MMFKIGFNLLGQGKPLSPLVSCSFRILTRSISMTSENSTVFTTTPDMKREIDWKEVSFKVPWGKIAGKEYGNSNGRPALAIHGWLDNSCSFDYLAPYIVNENNLNLIALDEPGCGFSSHKPPGSDYNRWSYLKDVKRVIDSKGWKEILLIGHSQGAHYSFIFSSIYPEIVKHMVAIDVPKPFTYLPFLDRDHAKTIEKILNYENLLMKDPTLESSAPIYDEENVIKKLIIAHRDSFSEREARALAVRGTKRLKDGYTFRRDIRVSIPSLDPIPSEPIVFKLMQNFKAKLCVILGNDSFVKKATPEDVLQKYYAFYREKCPKFVDVVLEGKHHLHMTNTVSVAEVINDFLKEDFASKETSSKHSL